MGFRSMTGSSSAFAWGQRRIGPVAIVMAIGLLAPRGWAQSPDELKAARELFQDAFKDEQEKRYPEALEKFQRVAKVKESASVRYRIATVLAEMGRLREARDMYRALAAQKASLPANDQPTADSGAEKAAELDARIPRLAVRVQDPPPDVRVTVDGAPVPISTTPRSFELDPGEHVVAATAQGVAPSEKTITLADGGGEVQHTVTFARDGAGPGASWSKNTTLPWIAIGGGAALTAAGTILLIVREGTIDDIKDACPGNVCPPGRRNEIEDDRDQAKLFGPLGGVLAVVGLVAVGAGVYLLVRSPSGPPKARAHHLTPRLGGMSALLTF
jgi:hypothetical protein